jgi:hypothetical protein
MYPVQEPDKTNQFTPNPPENRTKRTKRSEEPLSNEYQASESSSSEEKSSKTKPSRRTYRRSTRSKKASAVSTKTPSRTSRSKASREVHNNIEKQYRHRLNRQFDFLLASLPKDIVGADVLGEGRGCTIGAPSKGRVLDLAKIHIDALEMENQRISHENELLEKSATMFEMAFGKNGRGSREFGQD